MIKRILYLAMALVSLALTSSAAQWDVDVAHSSVGFSVSHMVISNVKGYFHDYSADINFEPDKLAAGTVQMAVQVKSIDTYDAKRDDHLRSADFFDVATYPVMNFKSTKIHSMEGNRFKLTGDLTIRDITKEVTFDCEFRGVVSDPWGNVKSGFGATAKINRQDFGVKWNKALDAGGVLVGDEVTINIELELGQRK